MTSATDAVETDRTIDLCNGRMLYLEVRLEASGFAPGPSPRRRSARGPVPSGALLMLASGGRSGASRLIRGNRIFGHAGKLA